MSEKGRNKTKKKFRKKKKIIISLILVAAVGTTAGYYAQKKSENPGKGEKNTAQAQSTEVRKDTISNTIVGTGNLELDEAEAVKIPSGLTIKEVLAESGDYVAEGTVLATVDTASVLSAVEDIKKELDTLDEQISDCLENEDENLVECTVAGRVKAVYVKAGSDVADVMVDKGALMELSLDGKLAVEIEDTASLEIDESVNVTLSDGTVINGTIDSVTEDGTVITVTDNGTVVGDSVTVTDSSGNVLGTGEFYIHKPLAITGTTGTVSSVSVSENTKVSTGETLLVLTGTDSDNEYQELMAAREARTETLKKLLALEKDPEIKAETDGTVEDVNVAASGTTDSSSGSDSSTETGTQKASQMSYTSSRLKLIKLSFDDGSVVTDASPETAENTEDSDDTPLEQQISFSIAGSGTSGNSLLVLPAPVTGKTPVTDISTADGTYSGIVTWNPGDSIFAVSTSYQALVVLTAADGYQFTGESIQGTASGTVSGIQVSEDGKTLEFQIAFPETKADENRTDSGSGDSGKDNTDNSNHNVNSGDDQNNTTGDNSSTEQQTQNSGNTGNASDTGNNASGAVNSQSSESTQAAGATGTTGSTSEEATTSENSSDTSDKYSTDVTAFTVAPDEKMILSVNVDELDINSVEKGQEATVTFDAIEDQEFTGTVTKIGSTASVNGGVAKYTVEITVPKEEKMKQGMNASATIIIEEKEQVLILPSSALQEKGDKTFVYTQQDSDGNLSGETEIKTGLSDGSNVEITEGLSEGDTVYYMRSEKSSDSSSDMDQRMSDMGEFPGGGSSDMGGGPGGQGGAPGGGPGQGQ